MVVVERKKPEEKEPLTADGKELNALQRFRLQVQEPSLANPEVLPWIEQFQRYLERDPSVGLSFSFIDILSVVNGAIHELEPKWEVLPRTNSEVQLLLASYFFGTSFQESAQVIDHRYRSAPIHFFLTDHRGETIRRVIQRARDYIDAHQIDAAQFRLAGGPIGVLAAANEELLGNDILVNILGFGTIFLVLVLTYRSITAGVYMIIPLLVANAIINAYMGARDIGINIHTLPVVTVGVGFGIDYALYVVSRIIEEHRLGNPIDAAVAIALATSGKAVTFTALTMILGTLFWTMSSLRFSAEMGLLLALWMGVSFLATMTLLPVLVALFKPRFITAQAAS
jgi:predicted RND superfamily exporter protein